MTLDWDTVVAYALSLSGTEPGTHYGKQTVKANGHALIGPGREAGSFVLHIGADTKLMLLETDPTTYWQTPHYEGWPSLLVRYDSADPERVSDDRSRAELGAQPQAPASSRRRARR